MILFRAVIVHVHAYARLSVCVCGLKEQQQASENQVAQLEGAHGSCTESAPVPVVAAHDRAKIQSQSSQLLRQCGVLSDERLQNVCAHDLRASR